MKTRYKYIHFFLIEEKPKTSVWSCRNNHSDGELGLVKWYPAWRGYCYFPNPLIEAVYDNNCLADIKDFIDNLEKGR